MVLKRWRSETTVPLMNRLSCFRSFESSRIVPKHGKVFSSQKTRKLRRTRNKRQRKGFDRPERPAEWIKMDRRYRALESGALELTKCGFWHVLKTIPAQEKRWQFQATTMASSKLSTGHSVKWGTIGPKSGWFLLGMPKCCCTTGCSAVTFHSHSVACWARYV